MPKLVGLFFRILGGWQIRPLHRSGGRGPTITHRQKGNISDVEFTDIEVVAEHHAARW